MNYFELTLWAILFSLVGPISADFDNDATLDDDGIRRELQEGNL